MRKLVLLAAAAAALAVPVSTASADCTAYGAGANNVSFCSRRVWEKQQYWVTCSVDTNLDGNGDKHCPETFRIEFYG